jgi:hypothetical protein
LHRRIVIGTAATVILGAFLMLSLARDGAWVPQDTLLVALATGTAPRVLDVRTTGEFAAGHIPGAIHVPNHQLWLRRTDLAADKTDPMVTYCSHGRAPGWRNSSAGRSATKMSAISKDRCRAGQSEACHSPPAARP